MKLGIRMRSLVKLLLFAVCTSYATVAVATTYYTNANLDFTSIDLVMHSSKFINGGDFSYFAISGTAFGSSAGIAGVYATQDQPVMQRCLAIAESFNLSRRTNNNLIFRIQVMPDPANASYSLIQYCTLYQ